MLGLAMVGHFATAAAVLVVLGCCQILFTTGCNTTLQLATPDALRGRVMGLYALAFAGMTPFGALLIGFVAEHLGVRVACAVQRRLRPGRDGRAAPVHASRGRIADQDRVRDAR